MKGKKCFGVLLVLSIIFGLSLNASLDVSAVDYTSSLDYVQTFNALTWEKQAKVGSSGSWQTLSRSQVLPSGDPLSKYTVFVGSLKTTESFDIVKDHLYQVNVIVWTNSDDPNPLQFIHEFNNSSNFSLVDVDLRFDESSTLEQWRNCSYQDSNGNYRQYQCYYNLYPSQSKFYTFLLKARNSGNFPVVLGRDDSYSWEFEHTAATTSAPWIYVVPQVSIYEFEYSDIGESIDDMNQKDNEDRDNLESQSSSTESSAESSSQDAENTGTTLLGAFSSFVTAITSATPSNCNFDMDLGNLDLGVVNLCQLSLPQPFPTIASIMLILFCVPLSISTARKVINLFRSFQ